MNRELILDLEAKFSMREVSIKDKKNKEGRTKALITDYASPFNHGNRIVCVGMYADDLGYKLIDFDGGGTVVQLADIISQYDTIVGHNVKYDVHWLRAIGIDTTKHKLIDTLTQEYCLQGGSKKYGQLGLDKLAPKYGGTNKIDVIKDMWKSGVNTDEIPKPLLHKYQYLDVYNTWKIHVGQRKKLATTHKWAQRICEMDSQLTSVTEEMEFNGIKVDLELKDELRLEFEEMVRDAERHLYKVMKPELDKIIDVETFKLETELALPPEKDTTHWIKKQERLKEEVKKFGGARNYVENTFHFDVGSPKQLSEMLYSIKLRPEKREIWKEFVKTMDKYGKDAQTQLDRQVIICFEKLKYGFGIKPLPLFVGANGASSGKKAIEALHTSGKLNAKAQEFVDAFVNMSQKNTWLDGNYYQLANNISDDGFIHGSFIQAGTSTGRYSSSNPNMQNQPSKGKTDGKNRTRQMLVSRYGEDGYIVAPDYSQLEYRGAFQIAGAKKGIQDFIDGMDLHTDRARWTIDGLHGEGTWDKATDTERKNWRGDQKTVNFGLLYGSSPRNDLQKAMFDSFYKDYPEMKHWNECVTADIRAMAYYECPMTGARYILPKASSKNYYSGYDSKGRGWKNKAMNYPVQGGSGRIMQVAMIGILEQIRSRGLVDVKFCGQVHDEILLDVRKKDLAQVLEIIEEEMVNVKHRFKKIFNYEIEVPMDVDVEMAHDYFNVKDISEYNIESS